MKHNFRVTLILVMLFLLSQLVGLTVISQYITVEEVVKEVEIDGVKQEIIVQVQDWEILPYGIERPEVNEDRSYIGIIISILIATLLALMLIKLEARFLWKIWFFLSVWFTLSIAFNAFVFQGLAIGLALLFAIGKIFKNNVYLHNFTELFIYGGLAVIFVPILSLVSIFVLLLLISLYDMYAVWKSKHMIKMAKFQAKMKLFAGLLVPYGKKKTAILGGGDLGFPLLFTGVVFKNSGWEALLIVFATTIALWVLLIESKKNRYYPAMPFIFVGCIVGYLLTLLV